MAEGEGACVVAANNILLVEDDRVTRQAMTMLLESAGYQVVSAANGREALDYLHHTKPPKLILLDLAMPVMDGWQFRCRQKADPSLAKIPVVMVSGASKRTIGDATTFLQKPIEFDSLLDTVRRYC